LTIALTRRGVAGKMATDGGLSVLEMLFFKEPENPD
jgi:hypothetical protein